MPHLALPLTPRRVQAPATARGLPSDGPSVPVGLLVSVWVLCPALIRAPVRYPVPASPLAALPVLSLVSLPARLPAGVVVSRLALALAAR